MQDRTSHLSIFILHTVHRVLCILVRHNTTGLIRLLDAFPNWKEQQLSLNPFQQVCCCEIKKKTKKKISLQISLQNPHASVPPAPRHLSRPNDLRAPEKQLRFPFYLQIQSLPWINILLLLLNCVLVADLSLSLFCICSKYWTKTLSAITHGKNTDKSVHGHSS